MASMLLVNALSFTVLSAVVIAVPVQESSKIPVTVYYESYCPDSIKFLTKQLYPVYTSSLATYLNLTLVPFGKSTYIKNETAYTFNCHHGAKECTGNKIHACAIQHLTPFEIAFKFINCASNMIMEDPKTENYPGQQFLREELVTLLEGHHLPATMEYFQHDSIPPHFSHVVSIYLNQQFPDKWIPSQSWPLLGCAKKLSISYDNIQQCSVSTQGDDLLASYGNKTLELEPKLNSVPYVLFNEKYVEGESSKAIENFKSELCAHITGTKPAECDTKSSAMNIQATIVPTIIALLISKMCI